VPRGWSASEAVTIGSVPWPNYNLVERLWNTGSLAEPA
jgi:hypothetical protein